MKRGGDRIPRQFDREGYSQPTRRITGRRSPTAAIAVGALVVALIILHFMGYSGGNGSIGHSPTNMLKQLPPNFLNSEGQLNVSEVLNGANVPNGIIEKVVNEIGPTITIPSGKKVKEILTETLKKHKLVVKEAKDTVENILRKSKSRSPGQ